VRFSRVSFALSCLGLLSPLTIAGPIGFVQTNLASDLPGANFTDPTLKNAWGLAASGASPFWLGVNGSGISELYNGAGVKQGLVVTIPGAGSVTGVAFSGTSGFNGDAFLFVSEDGTVSGWRGALGTTAEILATGDPNNVYKGMAVANVAAFTYAYLANFHTGAIDVMKGSSLAPNLIGNFTDPNLPAGFAPFNVANLGGKLYVSYAKRDPTDDDDVAGVGNGFVSVFDLNGNLLQHLVGGGALNSPWGMALAPAGFGDIGGALLVGNFGDGLIHAYNPTSGALLETLMDPSGNPISIDGLWALSFGNGANAGPTSTLYFTAGPNDESNGLFGQLVAAPEPGTWLLSGIGLAAAFAARRRIRS
jgi:uncharacterized protein (TIGR03118 family)